MTVITARYDADIQQHVFVVKNPNGERKLIRVSAAQPAARLNFHERDGYQIVYDSSAWTGMCHLDECEVAAQIHAFFLTQKFRIERLLRLFRAA